MAKIVFRKMHGLGNDFMVVDGVNQAVNFSAEQVIASGNRHTGVGFDQLLVIAPPETEEADFNYIIFNQDGSLAEQCGNGARCVAKFIQKEGLSPKKELRLLTAGKITTVILEDQGWVTVQMAEPTISPVDALKIANNMITFYLVNVGNPHAITLVDEIRDSFVKEIGAGLSKHAHFPKGLNVGFMQKISSKHIHLKVYERGVGPTLACGSGACAAAAVGIQLGVLHQEVRVTQPGGDLWIKWAGAHHPLTLQGPAEFVYKGEICI